MPLTVIGIALLALTALWARSEHNYHKRSEELARSAPKTRSKAPPAAAIRWLVMLAQLILAVAGLILVVIGLMPKS